jgi:hypothetical protein
MASSESRQASKDVPLGADQAFVITAVALTINRRLMG